MKRAALWVLDWMLDALAGVAVVLCDIGAWVEGEA